MTVLANFNSSARPNKLPSPVPPVTPDYWNKAKRELAKRDPVSRATIRSYKGEALQLRGNGFQTLARAIVGQQISVKAADSIWKKRQNAVVQVTPKNVAYAPYELLRPCGLSNAKVLYLHSLATHFLENGSRIRRWPHMDDEAIIEELITVKGVGRWTAEFDIRTWQTGCVSHRRFGTCQRHPPPLRQG
jgi:DNA-3-methyladenine glycosylase II